MPQTWISRRDAIRLTLAAGAVTAATPQPGDAASSAWQGAPTLAATARTLLTVRDVALIYPAETPLFRKSRLVAPAVCDIGSGLYMGARISVSLEKTGRAKRHLATV